MKHLPAVMNAIRAAWEGDKKKSAIYIEFLAEKLAEDDDESESRILLQFLVLGPTLSRSELLAFLELEAARQALSMARPA